MERLQAITSVCHAEVTQNTDFIFIKKNELAMVDEQYHGLSTGNSVPTIWGLGAPSSSVKNETRSDDLGFGRPVIQKVSLDQKYYPYFAARVILPPLVLDKKNGLKKTSSQGVSVILACCTVNTGCFRRRVLGRGST